MKKPIIYIAGPISNMPNGNKEAFAEAAATLRAKGYEAINPHELHEGATDTSWEGYMKRDIPHLCTADAVARLDNWEGSMGARLELMLAGELKIFSIRYDMLRNIEPQSLNDLIYTNKMAPVCTQ
jgi:hypothetical protein